MKRVLLILAAGLLLCGCKSTLPAVPSALPPGGGGLPPVPSYLEVDYTLEQETLSDELRDEDGTALLQYNYCLPKLVTTSEGALVGESAASKAFNEKFDHWRTLEDVTELTEWARQDYDWRKGENAPPFHAYNDEVRYSAHVTEHLVSVSLELYAYTGGAHPTTALLAYNFDLDQGVFLNAAALAEDGGVFVQMVAEELLRQMEDAAQQAGYTVENYYWVDAVDIVSQWTSYSVFFSEEGMVVGFSPYELAAYVAGAQVFTLPYSMLEPYFSAYGKTLLDLPQ